MNRKAKIVHVYDEDEKKYIFRLEGVKGGPVFYADSVEEGNEKMKELLGFGEFAGLVTFIKHKIIETISSAVKQHEMSKPTVVSE